jgi:predicted O-methyltransferase YrrM
LRHITNMNQQCIGLVELLPERPGREEVANWVRTKAGSNNNGYFKTEVEDALRLQQVPEEYAGLVELVLGLAPRSYLEVGIGNGGSWLTMSYLNRATLESSHAVDNLSYAFAGQRHDEVLFIRDYLSGLIADVRFYHQNSGDFFQHCEHKYDVAFIDGDHSYVGVRTDYLDALRHVNPGGIMIFHDVNSQAAPGVAHFWGEVKTKHRHQEFIHSDTCGIGVIYL